MLRDPTEATSDMKVLDDFEIEDLNQETINSYRNLHKMQKSDHVWTLLDDAEFLKNIGAAAVSKSDRKLHPTAAGLLMFGNEYDIAREFPEYFLDYREILDASIRWVDRLQSSSGEWSGNLFDFYFRVYNKLIKDVKVPFKIEGGERVDDTPIQKAIREALANCLINTDYFMPRGIVIKKEPDAIILENPGYIRVGIEQMRKGGESDPRNKSLMKMFNLVNVGGRAGSGVPDIFRVWDNAQLEEPIIEERFGEAARTTFKLLFIQKKRQKKCYKITMKGKNTPSPVRRVEIPKPDGGIRKLGIPTVIDRVIQQAMVQQLMPIYEPLFADGSYGYRPGRSAHDAILKVKEYAEQGCTHAVVLDLSKYFDTLNHTILMNILRRNIRDERVMQMIKRYLKSGVVESGVVMKTEEGSPQGENLSPLLANIYLNEFDHEFEKRGVPCIRYADDIVLLAKSKRASGSLLETGTKYLEDKLKLTVNRDKSRTVSVFVCSLFL